MPIIIIAPRKLLKTISISIVPNSSGEKILVKRGIVKNATLLARTPPIPYTTESRPNCLSLLNRASHNSVFSDKEKSIYVRKTRPNSLKY